ncbi:two-component system sensor histidine kinase PilS (NtrC family) [Alteromonadaceae bacterium 2753L.S.0a.02]|nr:two-component system sensor histidine kinase PilS (NtrC family) [Alteromonadaceae bacterium 2753L.S.0a.02]
MDKIAPLNYQRPPHSSQVVQVYLYYRLIVSVLLWLTFILGSADDILGKQMPQLFRLTSISYSLICLATVFAFRPSSLTTSVKRISLLLLIDTVALFTMIHASSGINSSLSYLLLINVAMASIFIRGQMAFAFAAMTSLVAIGEALYISEQRGDISNQLFAAGTLGILIFLTATSFHYLTEKIRKSDIEAAIQAQYAQQLQQLAQHIVTRMRTGIIVVDQHNKVQLINQSALQMLDLPNNNYMGRGLAEFSNIEALLEDWRLATQTSMPRVHTLRAGQDVRISFARLETADEERTILYMEDHRSLAQQAQQLKLASLGRLTASIAHEVRNPLGAISHAAQLLSEIDYLQGTDQRLIEIILQHSARVNQIIENTLVLSRRKEPKPENLELAEWLPRFINDYQTVKKASVGFVVNSGSIHAKFDPTHLTQVLTNLCDNGLRYSEMHTGKAHIEIHAGIGDNDESAYMDVIDSGPGVDESLLEQIFDPFYTTDEKGSGLGLYISKELCEINQATLSHFKTNDNKSCFRINCSHHQRMI